MTSPTRCRLGVIASAVALSLLVAGCSDPAADPAPSSGQTSATEEASDSPSPTTEEPGPSDEPTDSSDTGTAVPVYFVTDSGRGPRLVREFHRVESDPLTAAAGLVDGGVPHDPDYRTLWPGGAVASVEASDGLLVVRLEGDAFTEAPDGMRRREARLALQQLVYTLQGVQQARVPVQVVRDGGPPRLFGLDVSAPVKQARALRVLNLVNITAPEEGSHHTGDDLIVSGVANSFEANVVCQVEVGEAVLAQQALTAQGWMADKLFPFEGALLVSEVPSGEAVLRCSTDDPSGGAEGRGPMSDTKTITLD